MRLYPRQRSHVYALYRRYFGPSREAPPASHRRYQGFTKCYAVHRLVRFEMFDDMAAAIAREKRLKRWHRPWKINLIQSDNPDWVDLSPGLGLAPLSAAKTSNGS